MLNLRPLVKGLLAISVREVIELLRFENPWWQAGRTVDVEYRTAPRRAYLPVFHAQVSKSDVHRSVLLMGSGSSFSP